MRVVFCIDEAGRVVCANKTLAKFTGLNSSELENIPFTELFSIPDRQQVLSTLEQLGQRVDSLSLKASLLLSAATLSSNKTCDTSFSWQISTTNGSGYSIWTGTSSLEQATATAKPALEITKSSREHYYAPAFPLHQNSLFQYLEKMSDALLVLDSNWRYIYANKRAGALVNRSSDGLPGKHIWTEFPHLIGTTLYTTLHEALRSQRYTEFTNHEPSLDKWLERRIYPFAEGLLIFFSDITEKKKAEQKIQQTQKDLEGFKLALSASSNVTITDSEGNITWANDNFCNLSQYSPEELIGNTHGILASPFHAADHSHKIIDTFKKGQIWKGEIQNRRKDGSIIWVHSTVVPILNEQGNPSHNVVICQDITEKKKAEKELIESEKLYRTLIENYSDAVFLTDLQGIITKVNQKAEALSFRSREKLEGVNFLQFLSTKDRNLISTALPLLLQGKNLLIKTIISYFEKPFSAEVAIVPVQVEDQIRHFFVKFRDISRKVDYEKDIKLLNDTNLALSTATSVKEGAADVIRLLCQYGDFQYGEFWMPLLGQPLVKMKSSWYTGNQYRLMRAASEYRTFDIRVDKPQIFNSGKWYFSGNVQQDITFRRKAEAATCGIKSFLSIPLIYRNQFLGAFCLYSTTERNETALDPDRLQELVSKLGGELERRNSGEELDRFFNLSPELLGILCFDGYAKKFNHAFQQLLGYSEKELKELVLRELVHPEDQVMAAQIREKMLLGNSYKNVELRYRCKDGSYRWLSCSMQPVTEENLVYLTARDITLQKMQLEEIERIKIAIDNTSDAIGIASDLEHCLYTNHSFERLLGWNVSNLNIMGWTKIFVDPEQPYQIVETMTVQESWEGDIKLYDVAGNIRDFNLRANTFLQTNGNIKYLVGIFTDVTEQKKAQQELIRLSKAVEQSENEIYIIHSEGIRFSFVNQRASANLGYSLADLEHLNPLCVNQEYSRFYFKRLFYSLLSGKKKSLNYQTYHTRKNGSSYPVEVLLSLFEHGQERSIMASVVDITERQKAEKALLISNERYQLVTKATNDAIWDWDIAKQICYYGEGYKTLFGHSYGNSYSGMECWSDCLHPEDAERVVGNFYDVVIKGTKEWVIEYRFKCADGSYKYVKDRGYVIYDTAANAIRMAGALADISEQKQNEILLKGFNAELEKKVDEKTSKLGHALRLMRQEVIARIRTEETLHQSLQEKEVLLKEIHHRVKNNMAIISGLLSLQARYVKQDELKTILKDSQSRIKSMALIHELLYQNENLAKINFREYIHQLTDGISNSFKSLDKAISIKVEAADAELDIIQAVPCALILNELITNSYKYAFSEKQKGEITIDFKKASEGFEFTIADNGKGLPEGFDPQKTKSLGMQLVCNLVRQINGKMTINNRSGAQFKFSWV